jgi:hypothetical protein
VVTSVRHRRHFHRLLQRRYLSDGRVLTHTCAINISVATFQFAHRYFYSGMRKKCGALLCEQSSLSKVTQLLMCIRQKKTILFMRVPKISKSFVMSVHQSAWNISAPTRRIFRKFGVRVFFSKICWENSSFIKIDNYAYFTRMPVYSYDKIALNSS